MLNFEAIVKRIPPPIGRADGPLQALIFDSHYDSYRGVVIHIRVFSGRLKSGQTIRFMNTEGEYKVEETGIFILKLSPSDELAAGDVGYIIAGIKTIEDVRVGDTITSADKPCDKPLPGFREVKPVVFSSIYPVDSNEYEELYDAIDKLKLNDASLTWEKDSSVALGHGFRCGFLRIASSRSGAGTP